MAEESRRYLEIHYDTKHKTRQVKNVSRIPEPYTPSFSTLDPSGIILPTLVTISHGKVFPFNKPLYHAVLHEFRLFTSGSGTLLINNKKITFNTNDLIIIKPHELHQTLKHNKANAVQMHFFFSSGQVDKENPAAEKTDSPFIRFMQDEYPCINKLSIPANSPFIQKMINLTDEFNNPGPFSTLYTSIELFDLFVLLARTYFFQQLDHLPASEHKKKKDSLMVHDVIQYLNNNYTQKINFDNLFSNYNMNSEYARKLFKKSTGLSPVHYLQKIRMEKAEKLIQETDLPLSQIAQHIGISDYYYFLNRFKKYFGQSPGSFRELK